MRRRKLAGALSIVLAGALIGGQAAPAGAIAPTRFGSKLTNSNGSVKQNSNSPRDCDQSGPNAGDPCTMVSVITPNFGHEKAPKDGTINRLRLVASSPGSFRLYFALAHPGNKEAKIIKRGPLIVYSGNAFNIQVQQISISVKKGWYIAVKSSHFQTVTCNSGSPAQLEFQPPLVVGGPFETADDDNGCSLLVELQYQ